MNPRIYSVMETLALLCLQQNDHKRVQMPVAVQRIADVMTCGKIGHAKQLLCQVQSYASDHFYFEAASPGVIGFCKERPQRLYINIGGYWRTSIVWMKSPTYEHDDPFTLDELKQFDPITRSLLLG